MLSGILTTVLLVLFVGLWVWAWQPRLRKGFEETARLAVDDDIIPPSEKITETEGRTAP